MDKYANSNKHIFSNRVANPHDHADPIEYGYADPISHTNLIAYARRNDWTAKL
ncbi:MAG: hypothetical protein ACOYYS_25185 [Chloroflexota bacterium]